MRVTYTAVYEQADDGGWNVSLAEEQRVRVDGKTLAQVRPKIRQAAALWYHLAPTEFDMADDFRFPEAITAAVERARRERERAQAAQQSAVAISREAARLLVREANLSMRDAADILGMSHQRVQQLLSD